MHINLIIFREMKLKILFIAFFLILGCKKARENKPNAQEDNLEIFDFNGIEKFLEKNDGNIYVVNFWATWCAPCVKELPYFEKLYENYKSKQVEVILISLDFPHLYDSKLKPFIKENKLKSKVIVLDDPDMNTWIPKVDSTWSGSIPATLIYGNNQKKFFEKSFTYSELEAAITQFLN